jgi:endonuclease VIII
VAEGDTIHRSARALTNALRGRRITDVAVPNPQSPLRLQAERVERLRGAQLTEVEPRGKHLLLHFDGGLVLHSHLGMRGSWRIAAAGDRLARDRRAWAVLSTPDIHAVELDGSRLQLRTEQEVRSDSRLRSLGPDVLSAEFDPEAGVARLRGADQSRQVGEALLDQHVLAGIGNIYKSEGCWSARVDPWQSLACLGDDELRRLVIETAALMRYGVETGRTPHSIYRRAGRPCPRCGAPVRARGQGDANRRTYWCESCQSSGDNPAVGEDQ